MDTTEDSYGFTQEDEDALLHLRIISDEKGLRKLIKKFHTYISIAVEPPETSHQKTEVEAISEEEARESLLAEIATFQVALQKNALVCQAEARQVVEYEREKVRIAQEQEVTGQQIAKLKITLEEEQLLRKRKIEYDQVAEKVNMLPTRAELQAEIDSVQEEILAIQEENDHKLRMMHVRKTALDQIVSSLETLRQLDQVPEIQIVEEPPYGTSGEIAGDEDISSREDLEDRDDERRDRAREREARDREEESNESERVLPSTGMLNPAAKPFLPRDVLERLGDGEQESPAPSLPPSTVSSPTPLRPEEGEEGEEHEDIEMGEVQEQSPQTSALTGRPEQNELEEGEASDGEDPQAPVPSS